MNNINFSRIHFKKQKIGQLNSVIVIRIRDNQKGSISHTPMSLDRCCRYLTNDSSMPDASSIKDVIPRAQCNMTKAEFLSKYVNKRKPVMLQGCQKTWRARKWTFEGKILIDYID